MRALTANSTWKHVFPEDLEKDEKGELKVPPEQQTEWELYTLDASEEAYLQDRIGSMSDDGYSVKLGTQDLLALDLGLKGAANFTNENGDAVILERDQSAAQINAGSIKRRPWRRGFDKGISQIPKDVRSRLAALILKGPKLSEVEAKN
jgi:hypothetical protein